MNVLNHST